MVGISWETYDRNCGETIVDSDRNFYLNENYIEEGLDEKRLSITKQKCIWNHRKHRYKLVHKPQKQPNRVFLGF